LKEWEEGKHTSRRKREKRGRGDVSFRLGKKKKGKKKKNLCSSFSFFAGRERGKKIRD